MLKPALSRHLQPIRSATTTSYRSSSLGGSYVCCFCAHAGQRRPQLAASSRPDYREYATRRPAPRISDKLARHVRNNEGPITPSRFREEYRPQVEDTIARTILEMKTFQREPPGEDRLEDLFVRFTCWGLDNPSRRSMDSPRFRELLNTCGVSADVAFHMGVALIAHPAHRIRKVGNNLLHSTAMLGNTKAIRETLSNALLRSRKDPKVWRISEINRALEHLEEHVDNPSADSLLLALAGKILKAQKKEELALPLLVRALKREIAESWQDKRAFAYRDAYQLSTPWLDLIEIHSDRFKRGSRSDLALCEDVIKVGCSQEDPEAHWLATGFYERNGTKWLYHLTKAAASGHLQAAFELANFYRDSGWRYIEADPPDHLKPTPFDHTPPKEQEKSALKDTILRFFGWGSTQSQFPKVREPHEELYYTAVYPHKARDRYLLAAEWLDVAMVRHYAPAYLLRAKMALEKTLWHQADAPEVALKLSDERYTHVIEHVQASKEEPNPLFNIDDATAYLREVFMACEMRRIEVKHNADRQIAISKGKLAATSEELMERSAYRVYQDKLPALTKFMQDREAWSVSIPHLDDLYTEAASLCRQNRLNVFTPDGVLLYQGTD